jgi:hypothetical protein
MPIGNDPAAARPRAQLDAGSGAANGAREKPKSETNSESSGSGEGSPVDPNIEHDLTPLDFMLRDMRDTTQDYKDRKESAKAALPFVHSRLSPIAPPVEQESEYQTRMREASNSLVRKITAFRARLKKRVPDGSDGG